MKIVQINSSCTSGSTGKIAYAIHEKTMAQNMESYIFYSGFRVCDKKNCIPVNSKADIRKHQVLSRVFGDQGWHSTAATKQLIKQLEAISPDLIHLHNIHGYYLNMDLLFGYLAKYEIPVIWTLHDCWAFTGHCSYFTKVKCEQWRTHCSYCLQKKEYPYSWFFDRSERLFDQKQRLYEAIPSLTVTTVSRWLKDVTKQSVLLGQREIRVIPNGINVRVFCPHEPIKEVNGISLEDKKVVLGVASTWSERKGLNDFVALREKLPEEYLIVLIGLSVAQIASLPQEILGLRRTKNANELAAWYSTASVFFNASEEETFGLTTIEALACGTPAIVYDSTACPEPLTKELGSVVALHDLDAAVQEIIKWSDLKDSEFSRSAYDYVCRNYDEQNVYEQYINLYEEVIKSSAKI